MRSELAKLHLSMNSDKTEKCCWYQILRLITEAFDFSACQFITVYLVIFNTFSCFHPACWDRQSLSHGICFTRRSIDHCGGPWVLFPSHLDCLHDIADSRWSFHALWHLNINEIRACILQTVQRFLFDALQLCIQSMECKTSAPVVAGMCWYCQNWLHQCSFSLRKCLFAF